MVDIIKAIQTRKQQYKNITLAKCEIQNNQLYY